MMFLKMHFKAPIVYSILVLLLFVQCYDPPPAYMEDVKNHFGDLKYQSVNFPGKIKLNENDKIQIVKGVTEDTLSRTPNIYWFMVANAKGELGDFYVGSTNIASTGTVEMTVGDFIDGSKACWGDSDGTTATQGALENCLSQLHALLLIECVLASDGSSEFSCAVDCWFNNSQCF